MKCGPVIHPNPFTDQGEDLSLVDNLGKPQQPTYSESVLGAFQSLSSVSTEETRSFPNRVFPMHEALVLASQSTVRLDLIRNAGVPVRSVPARVDEEVIKDALVSDGASPRDIADQLAEAKARKIAAKMPVTVLGCDQILAFKGEILSKPKTSADALKQLKSLRGNAHDLFSAAVLFEEGRPIWRHIGCVTLQMRAASDDYLSDYVERNWSSIQHCVGSYQIEGEGIRLFERIDGDYFNVLGLPLLEFVSFLIGRGSLPS